MGARDLVSRILGKPQLVEGADYCFDDEWANIPDASFSPIPAAATGSCGWQPDLMVSPPEIAPRIPCSGANNAVSRTPGA